MEIREIKLRQIARREAAKALKYMKGATYEEMLAKCKAVAQKGKHGIKDAKELEMLEGFLSKLLKGEYA